AAFTSANNAPAPSVSLAAYRNTCGSGDTENNRTDWNTGAPSPRNSATPATLGLSLIGSALPFVVRDGDTISLRCTPRLCATNVLNPGTVVTANLSAFGFGSVLMHDDGLLGDDLANDGVYMLDVTIPVATVAQTYHVPVSANDGSNSGGAYISFT